MSYVTKIYFDQGGNRQTIEASAQVVVGSTTYTGAQLETLLKLLADLPDENVEAPGIWNDGGVLKVGTANE